MPLPLDWAPAAFAGPFFKCVVASTSLLESPAKRQSTRAADSSRPTPRHLLAPGTEEGILLRVLGWSWVTRVRQDAGLPEDRPLERVGAGKLLRKSELRADPTGVHHQILRWL